MAAQYPDLDTLANNRPQALTRLCWSPGREQDVGRMGDGDRDREDVAVRVVHHAGRAIGILVEAQRGGVAWKGHRAGRTRSGHSGPILVLSGDRSSLPECHHGDPLAEGESLPRDEGGAQQRHPQDAAGHESDSSARHQAQYQGGHGSTGRDAARRGESEQQPPGGPTTETYGCGTARGRKDRRHEMTPFALSRTGRSRAFRGWSDGGGVEGGGVGGG